MSTAEIGQYIAYGVQITTTLDFDGYLCKHDGSCSAISLKHVSADSKMPQLDEQVPLLTSHGRGLTLWTDRTIALSAIGQPWCFEVNDIVKFYWAGGGSEIYYQGQALCTDELLTFWFIHIFLPLFCTLEDKCQFIHACAVDINGDTVMFTAPSHGGKSTLTDFFLKQGHALVSDDKVATYLEDGFHYAVPSHPNHRPYRKFEDLGHHVSQFDPAPRRISAIYSLQSLDPDSHVTIEEVTGHQKFAGIRPSYLFDFKFLKEKRLVYVAELLSFVPVFNVGVPWDLDRLGEVHDAICRNQRHF